MAKPLGQRAKAEPGKAVDKSARVSGTRRAKRPIPATRREADSLYEPSPRIAPALASPARIARLMVLGVIPTITNAEAHQLILNAMYGDDGLLRPELLDP